MNKFPYCLILAGAMLALGPLEAAALPAEGPPDTCLHGDTPQLHIIAVNQDGKLEYPGISQQNQPLDKWSPDAFDVQLTPFTDSAADENNPVKSGDAYLKNMMDAIKRRQKHTTGDLKIVIHIHGGMNAIKGAVESAAHGYWVMEQEDKNIYPIFICWNSEPFSCYWDHVCYDRSGITLRGTPWAPLGVASMPWYLLGDLGSGLARSPSITLAQAIGDFKTMSPGSYSVNMNYAAMFQELQKNMVDKTKRGEQASAIHITEGASNFDFGDGLKNITKYVFTFPLKVATGGLINGLGPGAWSEMKRRVDLMFWTQDQLMPYEKIKAHQNDPETLPKQAEDARRKPGGMAWFLTQFKRQVLQGDDGSRKIGRAPDVEVDYAGLKAEIDAMLTRQPGGTARLTQNQFDVLKAGFVSLCQKHSSLSGHGYEISLIGHSMGAIVINEMIRSDPDIPYKKIVYMAAACSVKDFQDAVVPYMEDNTDCKFYNLCLNPEAELRNIELYDTLPRGGLLSWINDIFEQPPDLRHRMYGQAVTSVGMADIIPEQIRGRVYIKAFGFGRNPVPDHADSRFQEGMPQNHGEFNSFGEWNSIKTRDEKTVFTDPVNFHGDRPDLSNPHGFWTDDFLWYNPSPGLKRAIDPLTFQTEKNPALETEKCSFYQELYRAKPKHKP